MNNAVSNTSAPANEDLLSTSKWLLSSLEAVIAGKPVKCLDEAILQAQLLISRTESFADASNDETAKAANAGGLSVSLSEMRESNGRSTWEVRLLKSCDAFWDGHSVYTDTIKGRAEYEADSLKHFLGLGPEPDMLAYDTDAPLPTSEKAGVLSAEAEDIFRKIHSSKEWTVANALADYDHVSASPTASGASDLHAFNDGIETAAEIVCNWLDIGKFGEQRKLMQAVIAAKRPAAAMVNTPDLAATVAAEPALTIQNDDVEAAICKAYPTAASGMDEVEWRSIEQRGFRKGFAARRQVPNAAILTAIKSACDVAMRNAVAARIPECGNFGAIAQDLSWAISEMESPLFTAPIATTKT